MKINYMSDLHLEFKLLDTDISGDVLVLAGDISVKYKQFLWINAMSKKFNHIIYVAGNHEHYRGDIDKFHTQYPERLNENVHLLENESITIDGVTFHGATLWTSMNNRDPLTLHDVQNKMNDFKYIRYGGNYEYRFTTNYAATLHAESVRFLRNSVKPGDIVVTHHAPTFKSIHKKYSDDPRNYHLNFGYHSDLSELILDTKPKYWFHGHVHDNFDYEVGDTRVLCNPRGYAPMYLNHDFKVEASVEV